MGSEAVVAHSYGERAAALWAVVNIRLIVWRSAVYLHLILIGML